LNHDLVRVIGAGTLASNAKSDFSVLFARDTWLGAGCSARSGTSAIAAHTSTFASYTEPSCRSAAVKPGSGTRTNESGFRNFSRRADSFTIGKSQHRRRGRL